MNIRDWAGAFLHLAKNGIRDARAVEGICKKGMGARFLFAKVRLSFAPHDVLTFEVSPPITVPEWAHENWLDGLWTGVLDVMLVTPLMPITVFRCTLLALETHPVDTSRDALRLAGRAAAQAFLDGPNRG